eukprot:s605_g8.t1
MELGNMVPKYRPWVGRSTATVFRGVDHMEERRQVARVALGGITSPRPVRSRRLSAPVERLQNRCRWVTVARTSWRTAPSSMGYRIDVLPPGWEVDEVPWEKEKKVAGWLPIAPRGFVELKDLAEAPAEEELATIVTPPQSRDSPAMASPPGAQGDKSSNASEASGPCMANARNALLALREEHLRLREANIKLREREISKKQEIDSLEQRLVAVQDDLAAAEQEMCHVWPKRSSRALAAHLERSYQQQEVMNSKLKLCREAITTAVKSVDAIYDVAEDSPPEEENGEQVRSLATNASNASVVISELLSVTAPVEDNYRHGSENAATELYVNSALWRRKPLTSLSPGRAFSKVAHHCAISMRAARRPQVISSSVVAM